LIFKVKYNTVKDGWTSFRKEANPNPAEKTGREENLTYMSETSIYPDSETTFGPQQGGFEPLILRSPFKGVPS
jgi:hypothetical protein